MKAIVDAKTFSAALDCVLAVTKRSMVPILGSVHLQFGDGKCVLTATDMDTWLTKEIPAQGDAFICGFYNTKDAAKTCRYYDGALTIEVVDNGEGKDTKRQLLLSCGTRKAAYPGFPAIACGDFPGVPAMEAGAESFVIEDAAAMLEQFNRIKYAVGAERDNINATHTCVQFDRNKVFCMDGYRVACETAPGFTVPTPFMVYPEVLNHLRMFGRQSVTVHVGVPYVCFAGGGTSIVCHRQGVAPFQLDRAIPTEYQETVYVSPKEFLRELGYLKGLVSKRRPFLRLCGGQLSLENDPRDGSTTIHTEGESTIEVGFNIHFMADALKQFEKESRVKLKVRSPFAPIILEAEGRSDYALIMTARLREIQSAA